MIGTVDKHYSVEIYISPGEVEVLEKQPVEGSILHSEYKLSSGNLRLEQDRGAEMLTGELGNGKGDLGDWKFILNPDGYRNLNKEGKLNRRWDASGHHATVYDLSEAEDWISDRAEYLRKIEEEPGSLTEEARDAFTVDSENPRIDDFFT